MEFNKIIKKLNECYKSGTVTFNQMDACLWIENKYKTEMQIISDKYKQLQHNWNILKSFINEGIQSFQQLQNDEFVVAYKRILFKLLKLEKLEL